MLTDGQQLSGVNYISVVLGSVDVYREYILGSKVIFKWRGQDLHPTD